MSTNPTRGDSSKSLKTKVRHNFTLSPETMDKLRDLADELDTTMSGLISRWILEKYEEMEEKHSRH
jgi:predicted DNA-binding protein